MGVLSKILDAGSKMVLQAKLGWRDCEERVFPVRDGLAFSSDPAGGRMQICASPATFAFVKTFSHMVHDGMHHMASQAGSSQLLTADASMTGANTTRGLEEIPLIATFDLTTNGIS